LEIDSAGNLGLGVTPSAWRSAYNVTYGERALEVTYSALVTQAGPSTILANNVYFNSSNQWIYKNAVANTNAGLYTIGSDGLHTWSVAPTGASGAVATMTQVLSINKDKSLALQGATAATGTGITFPATQSASTDANTLDDYEEGTWTPSYSGGVTGVTYGSVRNGYYRKIGSQVTIWFGIMTDGLTVTTSGLTITGLPFTSASGAGSNGTVNISNATRWVSSPPIVGAVNTSATSIVLYNSIGATGAGVDPVEVTTGNMATGSGNRNLCFGTATYSA
jgi:hypothetical protein